MKKMKTNYLKKIALLFLVAIVSVGVQAKEGMWIPILLEKYNIEEMQQMGFKLTAEDVYSVNQACMKDAVVIFGGGCTGELISDQGLLITNYHCGYRAIQSHSSVDHDYLTDGFWAMNNQEELPNEDLKVTFLKSMKDVTAEVFSGVSEDMTETEKSKMIENNIDSIKAEAVKGTHYKAELKPFFHGNQYFLFINEIYTDVRLVGAPPSAIGKFGGDTDNWMWPRHTGDFSLFRIYADKDNKPAEYSTENVPYKPLKHFPVSLKGVKENDFTMVFGYPGSTEQYVPSYHIKMITEKVNPELIDLRGRKLDIINEYKSDPAVRIQYAAKDASISNSWKRWIGEIRGLKRLNAIEKKESYEAEFQQWANSHDKYKNILSDYKKLYEEFGEYKLLYNYNVEILYRNGTEIAKASTLLNSLIKEVNKDNVNESAVQKLKDQTIKEYEKFFKDYHAPLDKEMTEMLLVMYKDRMPAEFLPDVYNLIERKYKGDVSKYVDAVFKKSIFSNKEEVLELVQQFSKKQMGIVEKDPAYQLYKSIYTLYRDKIYSQYYDLQNKLKAVNKLYMSAQMEFQKDRVFYPDANFTLRVSYGKVKSFEPRDGVIYENYTTLEGIIEKDNPDIYDYRVPEKLKELYQNKDYGRYAVNGTVPVCFTATNHTTGGNSGSPVVNGNGELIGVNFDRAWEGVMSDMVFSPEQSRNISLDIRYVLFLIDKFAGAGYLLDEMDIVE
ncbi:S46 family peptidase [Plebeiibacterium sediminum]|uniref:Dipeptidyl-peptidase n=1 Tax=Plebeiibacterium sediminum TaxID=2992112 RepID=A0AAE3M8U3_9BACT|nr:S46 family peptidase [Plebeiobacterium sediminum]MCW3789024.1 S46 family peptidase [Plebeiobacterium sediminum]